MSKKIAEADAKAPLMLKCGKLNNFTAWREEQKKLCSAEFGFQANVLSTNEPYVPAAVIEDDFMPPDTPGMPALTAAAVGSLRLEAEKSRNKEVRLLKLSLPKFYATLLLAISPESLEEIRHHADFEAADLAKDANVLWRIIRETHLTAVHGAGEAMRIFDQASLRARFHSLKQEAGQSIGLFKQAYDDFQLTLAGAGVPAMTPAQDAMEFLSKLDMARYGEMFTFLTNRARLGEVFPETLHEAYRVAAGWVVAKSAAKAGGELHSVFTLADDRSAQGAREKSESVRTSGGRTGDNNVRGRGRGSCGRTNDTNVRGHGGAGRSSGGRSGAHSRGSITPASGAVELRTCRFCLKRGHLQRDCPDNVHLAEVLIAVGEDDDADEDAEAYEATFMVSDGDASMTATVLFSDYEVLLDNQAGRSIFRNAKLVDDRQVLAKPLFIGGIDGTSKGIRVTADGNFANLGRVGICAEAAANILSKAEMVDAGHRVVYVNDEYHLEGDGCRMVFKRRIDASGRKSNHYSCDLNSERSLALTTVEQNMRRYTKREVEQAREARELMARLAYPTSKTMVDMIQSGGLLNCAVTAQDVRNADAIFGMSLPALRGKTKKQASAIAKVTLAPRVTQVQQTMHVDIFFVKQLPFLIGVLDPLDLTLCVHLKNRGVDCVRDGLRAFHSTAKSRNFDVVVMRTDGEGAIGALIPMLGAEGIVVDTAGPGQHVPVAERKIQTVKALVRAYDSSLPFVLSRILLILCVLFCVSRVNMQPSRNALDRTSPLQQFTGRKLDARVDLRVNFGDYVQATVPVTDNTMTARTQGCIAGLPTGNLTGSVKMLCLSTNSVVTRDQFRVLPMPDLVVRHLNSIAESEGYTRGLDPTVGDLEPDHRPTDVTVPLPDMLRIDGNVPQDQSMSTTTPEVGVDEETAASQSASSTAWDEAEATADHTRAPAESVRAEPSAETVRVSRIRGGTVDSLQTLGSASPSLLLTAEKDFVFNISVRAALRDRESEARPVIMAELQQMVDKRVWHGVKTSTLTRQQRRAIIRSSMFLKDKYLSSRVFEKLKARLVAGGDQQDKTLYENLSSPTVSTTIVLTVAAIAAMERRIVTVLDIGGAFLNANMDSTGIIVHMRLDRVMTAMLLQIDESYREFLEPDGTLVVALDKALYGCVEAAMLWYNDFCTKLIANGSI